MAKEEIYWRTGRQIGRTIYVCSRSNPNGFLIGMMDDPSLADVVVRSVNHQLNMAREIRKNGTETQDFDLADLYWEVDDEDVDETRDAAYSKGDELDDEPPMSLHVHVVNEHSSMVFNGGSPVWLCGYAEGRCRTIVASAVRAHDGTWKKGEPYL